MAHVFSIERLIRFSHCDPAGIVYFVHFFDMISAAVEDWFGGPIGLDFNTMHRKLDVGFPIVNTQCEFMKPCHLGDRLGIQLVIAKLGRSSIEFVIEGRVGAEEKFRARHKIAMISLSDYRARPIPADLRARMQPFVAGDQSARSSTP
jgi:4-hydroxybenzoyl-CoA thioesterase